MKFRDPRRKRGSKAKLVAADESKGKRPAELDVIRKSWHARLDAEHEKRREKVAKRDSWQKRESPTETKARHEREAWEREQRRDREEREQAS